MAADQEGHTTIIIRRKKGGGGGHHGGAWKVAYADFVTAMMAFFLLLWLLNATTTEQKLGISNYFDPLGAVKSQGGGDGVLGGQSPSPAGSQKSATAPVAVMVPLSSKPTPGETEESDGDLNVKKQDKEPEPTDEQLQEALAKKEQSEFEKAEAVLRQAIQSVPELKDLSDSLKIDQTPEGLRIQLLDQDKLSMFAKGSSRMEEHTRRLIGLVATAIKGLPNKLTLSGHTDGIPYQTVTGYTNWELSSDRANASRKALIEAGVSPDRIAQVVGKADRDHLYPDEPNSPRNRRISIVLLRDTPIETATKQPKPAAAKAANSDAKPAEAPEKRTANAVAPPAPGAIPGTMGQTAPRVIEPPPPAKRP
ncbi:MAG: flagellar motor protein MotB [Alphaproteobacteria bacterium]|nr:flagellar motor protein MotB [Alphaproteobacteria bacterium]